MPCCVQAYDKEGRVRANATGDFAESKLEKLLEDIAVVGPLAAPP